MTVKKLVVVHLKRKQADVQYITWSHTRLSLQATPGIITWSEAVGIIVCLLKKYKSLLTLLCEGVSVSASKNNEFVPDLCTQLSSATSQRTQPCTHTLAQMCANSEVTSHAIVR